MKLFRLLRRRPQKSRGNPASDLLVAGSKLTQQRRDEEAIPLLQEAISITERFGDTYDGAHYAGTLDPVECRNAYLLLGIVFLRLRRVEDAVGALERARKIDPKHVDTLSILGQAYYDLARYDKAVETLCAATRVDPSDASAFFYLGEAYLDLKQYDEARQAYHQAARLEPEDYLYHLQLGTAYSLLGDFDSAVRSYAHSLENVDPSDKDALVVIHHELAQVYIRTGKKAKFEAEVAALRELDDVAADGVVAMAKFLSSSVG